MIEEDSSKSGDAHAVIGRRLAANFVFLAGGECIAKVLTFATFVYLGRVLGPELYGRLEFVLATMVFFTLAVDFGLGIYAARELARHPDMAGQLLRDVMTLRLTYAGLSFIGLLIVALCLPDADVRWLLITYGTSLFAAPGLLHWFFQGHDRMGWVALASVIRQSLLALLVFLFFRADTPLPYLGLFECLTVATVVVLYLVVLRGKFEGATPRTLPHFAALADHFRKSAPIGLSELAWALLWYSSTVFLALLAGAAAVGEFGAAHRVVMALHTFVWLYFFNLLPSLSRSVVEPRQKLHALMDRSLSLTAWAGIGVALGVTLLSLELLTLAYGSQFVGAAPVLAVLVWVIPTALISGHYRYLLIAYRLQQLEFYCTALSALITVAGCVLLIPHFGAVGAAFALLAANVMNLGLAYVCVGRGIAWIPFHRQMILPIMASGAALCCFGATVEWGVWKAGVSAGFTYLSLFSLWLYLPHRQRRNHDKLTIKAIVPNAVLPG